LSQTAARNDVKPFIDKQELQRFFQTTPIPGDTFRLLAGIADFADWYRGEDILIATASVNLAASQSDQTLNGLQPPDGEEWEILALWVIDSAAIDGNDTVSFYLLCTVENSNSFGVVPLTGKTGGSKGNYNSTSLSFWTWPNQMTTQVTTAQETLRLRRIGGPTGGVRAIGASATTTATVGTRAFRVFAWVRRRRIG
jgi:hypothetical protein